MPDDESVIPRGPTRAADVGTTIDTVPPLRGLVIGGGEVVVVETVLLLAADVDAGADDVDVEEVEETTMIVDDLEDVVVDWGSIVAKDVCVE
jgi:hypothetical protein